MNVFASLQMSSAPGYIRKAWYKWKALRLPWRRRFFVGTDLAGNTFWEFKDALHSNRYRRIVKYSRKTHYGDVKISRMLLDLASKNREADCILKDWTQRNGSSGYGILDLSPLRSKNSSTRSPDRH